MVRTEGQHTSGFLKIDRHYSGSIFHRPFLLDQFDRLTISAGDQT
jgi:hypothetical protein